MPRSTYQIVPEGWPCSYEDCPPGLFMVDGTLCCKTEYSDQSPFVCESGEIFWGGTDTTDDRNALEVQPVRVISVAV